MAYQYGFAGGYADAPIEPPQPPPVVGGGAPLTVRRRWVTRPFELPRPLPVSARARTTVRWRITARVVAVHPTARVRQAPVGMAVRRVSVAVVAQKRALITTKATTTVTVDQKTLAQFAHDMRELNELAVVLTLLE